MPADPMPMAADKAGEGSFMHVVPMSIDSVHAFLHRRESALDRRASALARMFAS